MQDSTSGAPVVIVGGGQAGGEVASELRKRGYAGAIVIVGDEAYPPYKRPALSKAYLAGEVSTESLYVMQAAQLEKTQIQYRANTKVDRIDRQSKTVWFNSGESLAYSKLVLATGGTPRRLLCTGAQAENVYALRSIADVERIRLQFVAGKRLVIIGGGFIGLEVAAIGVKKGLHVTVLEGLPRVLARVTAPEVSAFFEQLHRENQVDLRCNALVQALEGDPVHSVLLTDGTRISADLIIYGIGVVPNTGLAEHAGLAVNNGIVVDHHAQTEDPDILAAGDCTLHPSNFASKNIRLESVQNAMEQGRTAAATIMGDTSGYDAVPWFWSDQHGVKLQMVGLSEGYDQLVLRGDLASKAFTAFYLRKGVVRAVDTVNRAGEFMIAKKIVALGLALDPAVLADDTQPLKLLLPVT